MCNDTSMPASQFLTPAARNTKQPSAGQAMRVPAVALIALFFSFTAHPQDTRDVQEPKIPTVCTRLEAKLAGTREARAQTVASAPDTERIQSAIDHCKPGTAVELSAGGAHDAFLSGPLELR